MTGVTSCIAVARGLLDLRLLQYPWLLVAQHILWISKQLPWISDHNSFLMSIVSTPNHHSCTPTFYWKFPISIKNHDWLAVSHQGRFAYLQPPFPVYERKLVSQTSRPGSGVDGVVGHQVRVDGVVNFRLELIGGHHTWVEVISDDIQHSCVQVNVYAVKLWLYAAMCWTYTKVVF